MCYKSPCYKLTREASSGSDAAVVLTFDGTEVAFQSSIVTSSAGCWCWSDLGYCLQERMDSRWVVNILRKVRDQWLQRL